MAKKIIVYASGSYDCFHVGHLRALKKAKQLGDYLVVGVSTDGLVKEYKGDFPVIPFAQRCEIVRACRYVDKVVKQIRLSDLNLLKREKIDILTIGSDWKAKYLEGVEWMKKNKRVVYLPYTEGISTTEIKRRISKRKYREGIL